MRKKQNQRARKTHGELGGLANAEDDGWDPRRRG